MANYFLNPIYKKIFEEQFSNSFESRLEMQKAIYLLNDMGVTVGNYNFMWYKHGPYSQTLQNDILCLQNVGEQQIIFSDEANTIINKLKKAIENPEITYSRSLWLECLGSLHYIKENVLPTSSTDDEVLKELVFRKPHLDNSNDNKQALITLNTLFD